MIKYKPDPIYNIYIRQNSLACYWTLLKYAIKNEIKQCNIIKWLHYMLRSYSAMKVVVAADDKVVFQEDALALYALIILCSEGCSSSSWSTWWQSSILVVWRWCLHINITFWFFADFKVHKIRNQGWFWYFSVIDIRLACEHLHNRRHGRPEPWIILRTEKANLQKLTSLLSIELPI